MSKFYNVVFKGFVFILILLVILFCISGAYASQNIDNLAYVVALAIDVGSNNDIKLSIQLAKPSSSSSSSESSSQSSSAIISSVECSSIESGINLFNGYISRNINLSHCKAIVISESLAKNDLSNYLYDLSNNIEVSSHANIIITKCDANEFLKMSNPVLESLAAKYYEVAPSSSKYTGYTNAVTLIDFFSGYLDTSRETFAILGNINTDSTHTVSSVSNITNKDSSYVAGETPITSTNNVECMGIAVFKGATLVGELNGLESICHMIVSGKLDSCNIQVPDPNGHGNDININLKLNGNPKINVNFVNGFPFIKADIKLKVRILSVDQNVDYTNNDETELLENEINSYMEDLIYNYLYKVSKEFNSDIDGLGKYAVSNFTTISDWTDYGWLNNFENSFFDVSVNSKIKSGYNFIRT